MREQSHLEDMRSAVRGDRERAAARRAAGALDAPRAPAEIRPREPEPVEEDERPMPASEAEAPSEPQPRPGLVARLFGRKQPR